MRANRTGIYKSKFESEFAANFPDLEYEPRKFQYVVPASVHNYTPDFKVSEKVYIECKGRFTVKDRQKMILVKNQHPHIKFIMVFMNPNLKLGSRIGTCMDWAKKNHIMAFAATDLKGIKKCLQ